QPEVDLQIADVEENVGAVRRARLLGRSLRLRRQWQAPLGPGVRGHRRESGVAGRVASTRLGCRPGAPPAAATAPRTRPSPPGTAGEIGIRTGDRLSPVASRG